MELLKTLRRIRACEGEAAAQLLLEAYVAQAFAADQVEQARTPVAWRYWKEKFGCWEYSDTPLEFPAVPAGTKMEPLYLVPDASLTGAFASKEEV